MSWENVQTELKKLGKGLKYQLPSHFNFVKHSNCTRLYYIGLLDQPSNTLLYKDLQLGACDSPSVECFSKFISSDNSKDLSRDQELLRERMRIKGTGISSYSISKHRSDSKDFIQIIFTVGDKLNVFNDDGESESTIIFSCEGTLLNPTTCPHDHNIISFIQDGDINLRLLPAPSSLPSHQQTQHQVKLTHLNQTSSKKSAGMPSYIAQEEFDRYIGYWWKPNSLPTAADGKGHYQLLYEEVDENGVDVLHIPSYQQQGLSSDTYNYPRAGTTNATSQLKILDFYKSDMTIEGVTELHLPQPLHLLFPGMEYLTDAGWMPDASMVYAVMMNRPQTIKKVFLIPINNFQPHHHHHSDDNDEDGDMDNNNDNDEDVDGDDNNNNTNEDGDMDNNNDNDEDGDGENNNNDNKYYEILTETSEEHWINNHHLLHFLGSKDGSIVKVIFGTEVSSHLHLHIASYDLKSCTIDNNVLKPTKMKEDVLTSGDWDVDPKKLWVDEERKLVYFMAYKHTPIENHLFVESYNTGTQPHNPAMITTPGFSHSVSMDKDCLFFVSNFSSLDTPDRCDIYSIQPSLTKHVVSVTSTFVYTIFQKTVSGQGKSPKSFEFFNSTGTKLYGIFLEPQEAEVDDNEDAKPQQEKETSQNETSKNKGLKSQNKDGKYPVVVYVYGGPGVQLINNSYSFLRHNLQHKMSRFGFAVLKIDNRGSYNRGTEFEHHIKHKMGLIEISDQVDGLMHAHKAFQCIDLTRVAIMGWSYGGYMSLMGLAQRPDIFKVSISGAPVTSWSLYDTAYTERYMGTPRDNEEAYKQSSVIGLAAKFPNEANRLLIVHGLMDENVHFFHTSSLVEALNTNCKPFVLQTYPKERHGIRNADCHYHYETLVLHFLLNNL